MLVFCFPVSAFTWRVGEPWNPVPVEPPITFSSWFCGSIFPSPQKKKRRVRLGNDICCECVGHDINVICHVVFDTKCEIRPVVVVKRLIQKMAVIQSWDWFLMNLFSIDQMVKFMYFPPNHWNVSLKLLGGNVEFCLNHEEWDSKIWMDFEAIGYRRILLIRPPDFEGRTHPHATFGKLGKPGTKVRWMPSDNSWLRYTRCIGRWRRYIMKSDMLKNHRLLLEPQTTIYKWLFQLDDSKSLYRQLVSIGWFQISI